MNDNNGFSYAALVGGLDPLVIDRFVATEAAVNVTGPPTSKDVITPFVKHFLRWLKDNNNAVDLELRRRVLLLVTRGRRGLGTSEKDSAKLLELVDDVYRSIA